MTIIDKIKAEFQKRFEKCQSVSEDDRNALDAQDYYRGKYTAYSEAISFINMLLQEQEKERHSEDLKEAAEDFVWEVMENDDDGISELCRKLRPSSKISDYYDALAEFFIAGAEWQKEQMMKGAVYMTKCNLSLGNHTEKVLAFGDRFPNGEKVRVIIVKEEEE